MNVCPLTSTILIIDPPYFYFRKKLGEFLIRLTLSTHTHTRTHARKEREREREGGGDKLHRM